jgi:hypothetical protein
MLGAALRVEEQQRKLLLILAARGLCPGWKETSNVGNQHRNGG